MLAEAGAAPEFAAVTEATGTVRIERTGEGLVEVFAMAEGFGCGHAWALADQRQVTMTLDSKQASGGVRRLDGLPLEVPVTVLAVPRRLAWETDVERLMARPDVVSTESELTGQFVLSGLSDDAAGYLLYCGGGGWVGEGACKAGSTGIEIGLEKVYAGALTLGCDSCSPEELAMLESGRRILATGVASTGFDPDSLSLALAGGWPDRPAGESSLTMEYVYKAAIDDPILGRLLVEVSAPGFEPAETHVDVVDIAAGVPPVHLDLSTSAEQCGDLLIVDRGHAVLPVVESSNGSASLRLESASGAQSSYRIPPASDSGEALVTGIPFGSYSARLRRRPVMATYPEDHSLEVTIGAGCARIDVDQASIPRGNIMVEVLDPRGRPYLGAVDFTLTSNPPEIFEGAELLRGVGSLRFDEGPYLIRGMREGDWYIKLKFPHLSAVERVDIVAGTTVTARLVTEAWDLGAPRADPVERARRMARTQRYLEWRRSQAKQGSD